MRCKANTSNKMNAFVSTVSLKFGVAFGFVDFLISIHLNNPRISCGFWHLFLFRYFRSFFFFCNVGLCACLAISKPIKTHLENLSAWTQVNY